MNLFFFEKNEFKNYHLVNLNISNRYAKLQFNIKKQNIIRFYFRNNTLKHIKT